MSVLIDGNTRVLVQGITGREGSARTRLMVDYGTRVVAGSTPGKGGAEVLGIPVFDTVEQAVRHSGGIDLSVIFVPGPLAKDAAIEALDAGVGVCVVVPDRVPVYDVLEIHAAARANGGRFVGPNTLGIISPGRAVAGMIGGRAESAREWFLPGSLGLSSRSGGMTSSLAYYVSRRGVGLSSMVHVGGDSVVGTRHAAVCRALEADPETRAIAILGEIGGSQEEEVAELIAAGEITKPVFAYIGGKAAKEGVRFSHAGAIVEGNRGSHAGKVAALREAGATVVEDFAELPAVIQERLGESHAKT
ncbi:MAG: succinate--CoA ligase subunit alpha [bacterium]